MKCAVEIVQSNLPNLHGLSLKEATVRHIEFDQVVIRGGGHLPSSEASLMPAPTWSELELQFWHRNIIFEEKVIRLNGFVLFQGVMGRMECVVAPHLPEWGPSNPLRNTGGAP